MSIRVRTWRIRFSLLTFVLMLAFTPLITPLAVSRSLDSLLSVAMLFVDGEFACTAWSADGKTWVTADHCVDRGEKFSIGLEGQTKEAKLVKRHKDRDAAILIADNPKAKLFCAKENEPAYAGFPTGLWVVYRIPILFYTKNTLFGRPIIRWLEGSGCVIVYFQHVAAGGASGSPVVTPKGIAVLIAGGTGFTYAVMVDYDVAGYNTPSAEP